jgi:hypothetical protein
MLRRTLRRGGVTMLPTNVADWSDDDWTMHELTELANDPDAPRCGTCKGRTYDLLPSLTGPGDVCLGCAKREDAAMRREA